MLVQIERQASFSSTLDSAHASGGTNREFITNQLIGLGFRRTNIRQAVTDAAVRLHHVLLHATWKIDRFV